MAGTVMLGMRGSGDWSTDERPTRYREGMLKMMPNGDVALTAMSSKGRSKKIDDVEFSWFSKDLAVQGGDLTAAGAVYKDNALSSAYGVGDGAAAGTSNVYAKVAEAVADHFRPGHTALLVQKAGNGVEGFGKVVSVVKAGAGSYIQIQVKKTIAAAILDKVDYIDIVGNCNPQGGTIPDALSYNPEKFSGYGQIWRTPLDITRTARKTFLRTGDPYKELKTDGMLYHGVEIEQSALFSEKTKTTGVNGKDEYTCQGMIPFIREFSSDNVSHFPTDSALSWESAGEDWLDSNFEQVFRFGRDTKMAFCGSLALLGIMKLVKRSSMFTLTPTTAAYGIRVMQWVTPFGTIMLKRHPLFTYRAHRRNSIVIFEPENVEFNYIDDTFFKADDGEKKGGHQGYDGTKEEWLTEGGWEFHFPNTMMYLTGVGVDPS